MTDPNYTHVSFILDESGSMGSVRDDVIGGFNTMMAEQRAAEGKLTVSLCKFGTHLDNNYQKVYSCVVAAEVPDLSQATFAPSGGTPLLDAVGRHINELGNVLRSMPEQQRPSKVIVVIMTDGQENQSREFTSKAQIAEMIKRQEDEFSWTFVYMGANVDAFGESSAFGVSAKNAVAYTSSKRGTSVAYAAASRGLLRARGLSSGASLNAQGFYGASNSAEDFLAQATEDTDSTDESTERV